VQWSQWERTAIDLSSGMIYDPYDLPCPQNGGSKRTPRDMSNFERPYLRNGSSLSDPLHVSFRVFGVGRSNGTVSGSIKSRIAAGRHLRKLQRYRAVSLR